MCLAIPGRVESIAHDGVIRIGRVNFGGIIKQVCLDYVPEIEVGDYTIVHVGFALSKIDEATAEQTLREFRELGVLEQEFESEEEAFRRAAAAPQSPCPDGSCQPAPSNSAHPAISMGAPGLGVPTDRSLPVGWGSSHLGTEEDKNPNSDNAAGMRTR